MKSVARFFLATSLCGPAPATASAAAARKIYASGSAMPAANIEEIVELSGKDAPHVVHIGAASYDSERGLESAAKKWKAAGCTCEALRVAWQTPSPDTLKATMAKADIVSVGGGNTLFMYDRLAKLGADKLIQEAMSRGAVLAGGSAGGIIGFDAGHSDSMQPTTYKNAPGPLLNPNMSKALKESWAYIRVPSLGLVHGLFCPHYDAHGTNGIYRATDFTHMLQRHSGESAIGVDVYAAVMIDGDNYTVISRRGDECGTRKCHGSVAPDGSFTPKSDGVPGVWKLSVDANGTLSRVLAPPTGKVSDLLPPTRFIVESNFVPVARAQNPDDGKPPSSDMSYLDTAFFEPEWESSFQAATI